ncbi:MAG: LPXTG cell wall anchor domain-containing protein [Oscillospiraceae bacterium]|nr:LPXTG cell wall anchor domain-containing protein [Oscillospiraceae bacterium]
MNRQQKRKLSKMRKAALSVLVAGAITAGVAANDAMFRLAGEEDWNDVIDCSDCSCSSSGSIISCNLGEPYAYQTQTCYQGTENRRSCTNQCLISTVPLCDDDCGIFCYEYCGGVPDCEYCIPSCDNSCRKGQCKNYLTQYIETTIDHNRSEPILWCEYHGECSGYDCVSFENHPTCTEPSFYGCSFCLNPGCDYMEETVKISALGHDFNVDFTIDLEPDYENEGSKSRHCLRPNCGEKTDITAIPRLVKETTTAETTTTPESTTAAAEVTTTPEPTTAVAETTTTPEPTTAAAETTTTPEPTTTAAETTTAPEPTTAAAETTTTGETTTTTAATTTTPEPNTTTNEITTAPYDIGDEMFRFKGAYEDLLNVYLNDKLLSGNIINNGKLWELSLKSGTDYGFGSSYSYTNNMGKAYEGSVVVVLFADFLKTLPRGTYHLKVEFKDGTFEGMPFDVEGNEPQTTTAPVITISNTATSAPATTIAATSTNKVNTTSVSATSPSNRETNPATSVVMPFTGVLLAGGAVLLSRKKKKSNTNQNIRM